MDGNMRGVGGFPTYVKRFYIFHGFKVVRSRNQAIRALTEKPPTQKTLFSYSRVHRLV